ncbi:MAG: ATP-binding protein [Burkholderiales bacterium]
MTVEIENNANRVNRIFAARLGDFDRVRSMVEEFADKTRVSGEDRHKLTLIVEELFINTVTHGHKGDCDSPVSITLQKSGTDIMLLYEDAAPPFNPLGSGQSANIDDSIRKRRIGGLGVFLTTELAHGAAYSYDKGRNRIHLTYSPAHA